jgi:hypothetical protein
MSRKNKKKEEGPELKDYIAIFIALLETTFLPVVITILILIFITIILLLV